MWFPYSWAKSRDNFLRAQSMLGEELQCWWRVFEALPNFCFTKFLKKKPQQMLFIFNLVSKGWDMLWSAAQFNQHFINSTAFLKGSLMNHDLQMGQHSLGSLTVVPQMWGVAASLCIIEYWAEHPWGFSAAVWPLENRRSSVFTL